eukprot:5413138-Pyramimonas_sp.AAC.1
MAILILCRSTQTTLLFWHRSHAFGADKTNWKQGILGSASCMQIVARAWRGILAYIDGVHRFNTSLGHRGLPHQCRENA